MVDIEEIEDEPKGYPAYTRVEMHSLKRKEWNGKIGVVQSTIVTNGRQQVLIDGKPFALKIENLKEEEREFESLTVKELKSVLEENNLSSTSVEKDELRQKARTVLKDATPAEIAKVLAKISKKSSQAKSGGPNLSKGMANQAADQLSNMTPEQLRQQAQMLRSMPPESIRRMNPQFANMSNSQIQMAATQMEMMANNPSMMKMASEQMKNMSDAEIEQLKAAGGAAAPPPASTRSTASASANSSPPISDNPLGNMTPEQLKQQAEMMKTMTPAQIRNMNPHLANMSDDQVRQAVQQMEAMANNPSMMQMAMDQMKNMSPNDIKNMREGRLPTGSNTPSTASATKMLADMDPAQLKSMLESLQGDPSQLDQLSQMSGIPKEQLKKGIDMFAGMDEQQMESAVSMMQKAQRARDKWTETNSKVGGHLPKIVILLSIIFLFGIYQAISWYRSPSSVPVDQPSGVPDVPSIEVEDNEF